MYLKVELESKTSDESRKEKKKGKEEHRARKSIESGWGVEERWVGREARAVASFCRVFGIGAVLLAARQLVY